MNAVSELAATAAEVETGASAAAGCRPFALLCPPELRERYAEVFRAAELDVAIYATIEQVLAACVESPPAAMLIDMCAMTRLGVMVTAPLLELKMDWPIMRCAVLPDGTANIMCLEPPRFGSMQEALGEIAAGEACWRRPQRRRVHLRLDLNCRVRLRVSGEEHWRLGNTTDLSGGGAFVITYEPPEPDAAVHLEILDLAETPLALSARVVWRRAWEPGLDLPGVALEFVAESVSPEFKRALARPEHMARLFRV